MSTCGNDKLGNAWRALDESGDFGQSVIAGIVNGNTSVFVGDASSCNEALGCYRPGKITISDRFNSGEVALVIAHEYTHSTQAPLKPGTPDEMANESAHNELAAHKAEAEVYQGMKDRHSRYTSQARKMGEDELHIDVNASLKKWIADAKKSAGFPPL